jgi:hypothetical protein
MRGSTDDVEGTWELGGDSMIIDIKAVLESPKTLEEFVRWLRSDRDMAAHAVGGLLLLLTVRLEMDAKRGGDGLYGASIEDLAPLVTEPVVAQFPRPRQVGLQPLWEG